MSDPNFDGLCGWVMPSQLADGTRLRCTYDFGHGGDHSWVRREGKIRIGSCCQAADPRWLDRPLEIKP